MALLSSPPPPLLLPEMGNLQLDIHFDCVQVVLEVKGEAQLRNLVRRPLEFGGWLLLFCTAVVLRMAVGTNRWIALAGLLARCARHYVQLLSMVDAPVLCSTPSNVHVHAPRRGYWWTQQQPATAPSCCRKEHHNGWLRCSTIPHRASPPHLQSAHDHQGQPRQIDFHLGALATHHVGAPLQPQVHLGGGAGRRRGMQGERVRLA